MGTKDKSPKQGLTSTKDLIMEHLDIKQADKIRLYSNKRLSMPLKDSCLESYIATQVEVQLYLREQNNACSSVEETRAVSTKTWR